MPEIKPGTGVSISKRATAAYKKLYLTDRIKREIDDRNSSVEDEGRVVASGSRKVDLGFEDLRVESLRKGNNIAGMDHVFPKH